MKIITLYENSLEDMITEIKKTTWFKSGNIDIFRGTKSKLSEIKEVSIDINRDRKPLDTPSEDHEIISKLSKEIFGFNIRNGLFLSQSIAIASGYGTVNLVIPKDGYKLYSSKNATDFYTDIFRRNARYMNANDKEKEYKDYLLSLDTYKTNEANSKEIIGFGGFYIIPLDIAIEYDLLTKKLPSNKLCFDNIKSKIKKSKDFDDMFIKLSNYFKKYNLHHSYNNKQSLDILKTIESKMGSHDDNSVMYVYKVLDDYLKMDLSNIPLSDIPASYSILIKFWNRNPFRKNPILPVLIESDDANKFLDYMIEYNIYGYTHPYNVVEFVIDNLDSFDIYANKQRFNALYEFISENSSNRELRVKVISMYENK